MKKQIRYIFGKLARYNKRTEYMSTNKALRNCNAWVHTLNGKFATMAIFVLMDAYAGNQVLFHFYSQIATAVSCVLLCVGMYND